MLGHNVPDHSSMLPCREKVIHTAFPFFYSDKPLAARPAETVRTLTITKTELKNVFEIKEGCTKEWSIYKKRREKKKREGKMIKRTQKNRRRI